MQHTHIYLTKCHSLGLDDHWSMQHPLHNVYKAIQAARAMVLTHDIGRLFNQIDQIVVPVVKIADPCTWLMEPV